MPGGPCCRSVVKAKSDRDGDTPRIGDAALRVSIPYRDPLPELRHDDQFCLFRARQPCRELLCAADGVPAGNLYSGRLLDIALHRHHRSSRTATTAGTANPVLFAPPALLWFG